MPEDSQPGVFATTHWSVVVAAQQSDAQSLAALDRLCRAYWYPLYAFARRQGHNPEDARDLTQDFFAQMLARGSINKADPERGRFRSFLLASFKNMLANNWKRANRQKRGGGDVVFSLDDVGLEDRYRQEPAETLTPESLYERRWAETLLIRVIERLRLECDGDGAERSRRFQVLKTFLVEEKGATSLANAAAKLGLSVVATKGVVHRLRQRYREIFREEIEHTVGVPGDVEDEIRHLLCALAS